MVPISTTSLRAMDECERGFASRYIHKHGHADTKATFKGNARHQEYEKMAYDPEFRPVPPEDMSGSEERTMQRATDYVAKFLGLMRAKGGVLKPEVWVAINRDGSASKYGAAIPPYIRVKTDLYWSNAEGTVLGTFDWKSGSWLPEVDEVDYTQTRLTALALLKQKTAVKAVIGGLVYTAHQRLFPITVTRAEVDNPADGMQDLLVKMAQYEQKQKGDLTMATRGRWCAFCKDTACPFHPSI